MTALIWVHDSAKIWNKIEGLLTSVKFSNEKILILGLHRKTADFIKAKGHLNVDSIQSQNSILDDLWASIEQVEAGALDSKKKKDEVKAEANVFNAELSLVTDQKIIDEIDQFYRSTMKRNHECHRLRIKRVFEVSIDSMSEAFEKEGRKVGNIKRLWHLSLIHI